MYILGMYLFYLSKAFKISIPDEFYPLNAHVEVASIQKLHYWIYFYVESLPNDPIDVFPLV